MFEGRKKLKDPADARSWGCHPYLKQCVLRYYTLMYSIFLNNTKYAKILRNAILLHVVAKRTHDHLRLISYLLPVPATSAFTEEVSSDVNVEWRGGRIEASLNLINNDLLIYFNMNY